jgi:hypothetical protein
MAFTKSELFSRKSKHGLFSVVQKPTSTVGDIFFVNSAHGNATDAITHGRDPEGPFATIDYAVGRATASAGDIIYVNPHHTETITTAITMDKIGLSIIGLGRGMNRPIITPNAAIDAVTMTAAGSSLANFMFAAPGVTSQTADVNVAAANCSVINTHHLTSAAAVMKIDIITLTSAADDCLIRGTRIYQGTDLESDGGGIAIEGALANLEVDDVYVFCTGGDGFALGALYDGATATGLYIHDSVFMNDKADTVCVELGNNSKGVMMHVGINGRHTTLASNMTISSGMAYHMTFAVEEAGVSGYVCPVVDAD